MVTDYCIICKELARGRYRVMVTDKRTNNALSGFICRGCYLKFIKSHNNEGLFGIYRFRSWFSGMKKDMFRL